MAEWGTVSFEIPDFLEGVRDNINSVTEFLVTFLDIALAIAQFIKTFAIAFLDPIAYLVQLILDEVQAFLDDLRGLGIYLSGDWKLAEYPYDDLLGGYAAYERRMVARFTDRQDPTTPNVSSDTKTLALFFYLSADSADIQKLISFLGQLLAFFNQSSQAPGGMPVPKITQVLYGSDAVDILHAESLPWKLEASSTPPAISLVKWVLPTSQKNAYNPLSALSPGGFVVTVSTIPDGIQVVYDRPVPDGGKVDSATFKTSQPREYGKANVWGPGKPLVLFGGADTILFPSSLEYNSSLNSSGEIIPGKSRVYGKRLTGDSGIIPLELLKQGGVYFFQRVFYLPTDMFSAAVFTGDFSEILKLEDMPHEGKVTVASDGTITITDAGYAPVLYVRIASCTETIVSKGLKYDFNTAANLVSATNGAPAVYVPFQTGTEPEGISSWSDSQRITFPNSNTKKYIEALKSALVVLVLSRPDLIPLAAMSGMDTETIAAIQAGKYIPEGLALLPCGLEGVKQLTGLVYQDYKGTIEQKGLMPGTFRADLMQRIDKVAHDIYNCTGAMPDVERFVVEQTEMLRTVTWGAIFKEVHSKIAPRIDSKVQAASLLESLDMNQAGANTEYGLASNPYGVGHIESVVQKWFRIGGLIQDRDPQMVEGSSGNFGVVRTASSVEVETLKATVPPGYWSIYEKWIQSDGSLVVEEGDADALTALDSAMIWRGSADLSPVFYVRQTDLGTVTEEYLYPGVFYCRGLFAKYQGGELFRQAALTLSVAGAAGRALTDGQWWSIRFFDAFPAVDDCLDTIFRFIDSIRGALDSIVALIMKYIGYLEARLIEMQQFILRINALLQSLLSFSFQMPQCSALMLTSNGTGGVLSDLLQSTNKPSDHPGDGPMVYGAGAVMVMPFGPGRAMDFVNLLFPTDPGALPSGFFSIEGSGPPDAIGIEDLPAPVPPGPGPPDVL